MIPRSAAAVRLVVFLLLSQFSTGCGGETLVQVTGTATRGGKAVADLAIHFSPEKGLRSYALTDREGKFTMVCSNGRPGVRVGTHKVWVQLPSAGARNDKERQQRLTAQQNDQEMVKILEKYGKAETTPIVLEITENKEIQLTLD